tara:strand:- start:7568 stop:9106 length:1539 start_codon:yes stop_codon:yes gene_type:complete
MRNLDVLFINPGNASGIYQGLSKDFSAIETPTWSLLLAEACRSKGFAVQILDVNAERLSNEEACDRILNLKPKLVTFVVYGQNPNSGTVNMAGAVNLCSYLKKENIQIITSFVGSHAQALPMDTMINESDIDIAFTNEGVYSICNVLSLTDIKFENLKNIKGLCIRDDNNKVIMTPPEKIVPQERMDIDLPGYAWDLLPYKKKPLDLYRAHFWHGNYDFDERYPFAALYTSLGCKFKCNFCMINIINRNDNNEVGQASDYAGMRYWSTNFIIKEFDKLVKMGVKNIRISDEMFLLNKKFYLPLCQLLQERGYGKFLNMWAYSRVDTINPNYLSIVKDAGIKTLALGIESGDRNVRLEVTKGAFTDTNVNNVVKMIHDSGLEVMANYLFGLTSDDNDTMKKTLDLSLELNTLGWNAYPVLPIPGSQIYKEARKNNQKIPKDYLDFSFHSYTTRPLGTEHLTPEEVLKFRDNAFLVYHQSEKFLSKIKNKFGQVAVDNINQMTSIKLKREILGD